MSIYSICSLVHEVNIWFHNSEDKCYWMSLNECYWANTPAFTEYWGEKYPQNTHRYTDKIRNIKTVEHPELWAPHLHPAAVFVSEPCQETFIQLQICGLLIDVWLQDEAAQDLITEAGGQETGSQQPQHSLSAPEGAGLVTSSWGIRLSELCEALFLQLDD